MRNPNFSSIHPIVTAKVPIVKGYYVPGDLEMDISVYNVLAVHNTRLLYTYAYIDQRVQVFTFVLLSIFKRFIFIFYDFCSSLQHLRISISKNGGWSEDVKSRIGCFWIDHVGQDFFFF